MADDEQLSETLLDLFVYAPIGLALEAKELIPQLAERGRGQVALARFAGSLAARQGGQDPSALLDGLSGIVSSFLADLMPDDPTTDQEQSPEAADEAMLIDAHAEGPPIPGYDTMTAAEIVPTLAARSDEERIRIADYERAHRNRRTILNRIEQLRP